MKLADAIPRSPSRIQKRGTFVQSPKWSCCTSKVATGTFRGPAILHVHGLWLKVLTHSSPQHRCWHVNGYNRRRAPSLLVLESLVPTDQMRQWVSISSGDLTAEIDPLGAQLSTLRDRAGRDLLWNGDASIWAGRAPILFPIVGALAAGTYHLGSKVYRLSRHGFARTSAFAIGATTATSVAFVLKANDATLALYPFNFELEILLALEGPTLSITASVKNLGRTDMPASFGYHPAFRWPLPYEQPRASHFIEFESDEPAPVRRLDAAGLLSPERHATPVRQRRLALSDALFQNDALIFDDLRSRVVTYGAATGPRLRIGFPDTRYLGVWMKPGANFVCIEPWHGIADPQGYSGDFSEKPGIFIVTANASRAIKMTVTLLP
jgi:galactose mutarotase-like enzyme